MRTPSKTEQAIFNKLMSADFQGKEELTEMLAHAKVRTIDEDGSLAIECRSRETANIAKQIPVEGQVSDVDGVFAHALLHVRGGRPTELEIYKDDGSRLSSLEVFEEMEITTLSPYFNRPSK